MNNQNISRQRHKIVMQLSRNNQGHAARHTDNDTRKISDYYGR